MASTLYHEIEAHLAALGDDGWSGIFHRAFAGRPWMVETYTGPPWMVRWNNITRFCEEEFGEEAKPFAKPPADGRWYRHRLIVRGWTWVGFEREEDLRKFAKVWALSTYRDPRER